MIELFNSRKMIILVMILAFACVLIIILESLFTDSDATKPINSKKSLFELDIDESHKKKVINNVKMANKTKEETNSEKLENTSMCWLNEDHVIKKPCLPCADHEHVLNDTACLNTGYKELVRCKFSGEVYRSCIMLNDSRSFWSFQFTALLLSSIGYCLVRLRTKQLDHKMLERFKRQLPV